MTFCYQVPKDAILIVNTGMDDVAEYENEYPHDEATKHAEKWNIGGYHPDVWMTISYMRRGVLYECLWLSDGLSYNSAITGFIYGHKILKLNLD